MDDKSTSGKVIMNKEQLLLFMENRRKEPHLFVDNRWKEDFRLDGLAIAIKNAVAASVMRAKSKPSGSGASATKMLLEQDSAAGDGTTSSI